MLSNGKCQHFFVWNSLICVTCFQSCQDIVTQNTQLFND